ncbi:hypothetical protein [Streptomyces sp. NPDC001914]|uniref:hypothetical protein n=1 Tax=Streptomyces sp. NPDC001914 TaxID=3364623 RepID=UPI0036A2D84A
MNRRSRIRDTAGVVAASAAALVAVQGSSAGAAADESGAAGRTTVCVGTRPTGSLPGPEGQESSLYRVLGYVEKRGETRYASVFTGLSVDEDARTADVYRIPSEEFDADVCAHAEKGIRVRLHDTDVTARRLQALVETTGDRMDRWDGRFDLREVGPDPAGFVFFGVDDPAKADLILKKDLGPFWAKHIRVEYVGQASLD